MRHQKRARDRLRRAVRRARDPRPLVAEHWRRIVEERRVTVYILEQLQATHERENAT